MIANKDQLLSHLTKHSYAYTLYEHPPIFTVQDAISLKYRDTIPGTHVKNLFLRNQKKSVYLLVTVKEEKQVDLNALGERLNLGRLSFASENDLRLMLGVEPGSVTPIAIVNDALHQVKLLFDLDLSNEEHISIHPMENTATISIKLNDLLVFLKNAYQRTVDFIEIKAKN